MNLRVQVLCETDDDRNILGCGHIRLLRPLTHPALADSLTIITGAQVPQDGMNAVLVERCWRSDVDLEKAENLVSAIRRGGSAFIYTLDDNLLDLRRGLPWHDFPTREQRSVIRYFLRQADGVIVSTQALRDRLLTINPKILVVPNALDEQLFVDGEVCPPPSCDENGPMTIGYMGTYSHLDDLMLVLEPLRAVLRQFRGKVEFQMVGVSTDERLLDMFAGLPFRILDVEGMHAYPDFVVWARKNVRWDVAIAPLEDNAFTRCKSDIKYLDYALLGIPGIFSDVEAYRQTIRQGENGWLCRNTPQEWHAALEKMVAGHDLRLRMRQNAHEQVMQARVLKHCAVNWKNAIIRLADGSKAGCHRY